MAENSTSKNQQFLQQFERQRLNKSCNRIIDLRGKVAGECQAYTFGGKTHYLDDRAYLLAKQLLDHFNGRYTFGVYESLLKALKSLQSEKKAKDSNLSSSNESAIQFLPFDQSLQRKELRIAYASPVEIRIDDMLYHGATMDITSSAISVSLKRAHTLDKGDELSVTFPTLAPKDKAELLTKISYTVFKIDHDELRTQLILIRNRQDNSELTAWFDKWSERHSVSEYLDLDNELFNLSTHYYLRLYCRTLNSPLFWLNHNNNEKPIQAFQLGEVAEKVLQPLQKNLGDLDISLLPFEPVITNKCDYLLVVSTQDGLLKRYLARRTDTNKVALLLNWHSQQSDSHVFLLQISDTSVEIENFEQEIQRIEDCDADYATKLRQRLKDISLAVTVSDITNSCHHLVHEHHANEPKILDLEWDGEQPLPTTFRHHIQRDNQRFLIRTTVRFNLPRRNISFDVTTTDVSSCGAFLKIDGAIVLKVGSSVTIDFVRWQTKTQHVELDGIPYIVRSNKFRSGISYIGLERDIYRCNPSINKFFTKTIERNKAQLVENNSDIFTSQETKIFSSLLAQKLTTIPFYLAMDKEMQRHLHAVATSNHNHANKPQLWLAMQVQITAMSQLLNKLSDSPDSSVSFGLYCYQDNSGQWKIQADYALTTTDQKSLVINQALQAQQYAFYHCTLTPIKSAFVEQEGDLNQSILEFRTRSPHKVKQVREVLHSLFAVGELIDITDILKAKYQ